MLLKVAHWRLQADGSTRLTKVTAKVDGSVLTKVQVTVLGPVEDHVVPKPGLVTVMAREDAARESRTRQ